MDTLSIILPVYNEKESIEVVLKEWQSELKKYTFTYRFILCEDGSTDGTTEFLRKIESKYKLILNQKTKRRGYGVAVIDGIKTADSKYILCIDSDGQCDPKDFQKFWLNRNKAEVIIGQRHNRADPIARKLFSFMFKIWFRALFRSSIKDPSCPFVLVKRKTVLPFVRYLSYLKEGFWWGFVAVCVRKNLSIHKIPVTHKPRIKGDTQVYKLERIFNIAYRNAKGLLQLKKAF